MKRNYEVTIGSKILFERFDGNGIPDESLVTDIFKTNLNKIFVETVKGLIFWDWENKEVVVFYDTSSHSKAYSYISDEYYIKPSVLIYLKTK